MKIILTGATGFIGRALCNELAKEHNVIALTRRPEKASVLFERPVDIIKWNPKGMDGWEKCLDGSDAIVNLAGSCWDQFSIR
jgi:NAD dependent epimerase/dehydratase family enzyme